MKKALLQACALSVGATGALAGGLDRSGQGINLIFEEGSVVQFRLGYTDPSVSGTLLGTDSGDVANSFFTPHLGYKAAITDKIDFAIMYDQPFGADISYAPGYFLSQGGGPDEVLDAKADVDAITAVLRYKFDNGFSALGGIRAQRVEARVGVPIVSNYSVDTDATTDFGYLVGVAWEKPEIAARVSLTYNSKITHDLSQTETLAGVSSETGTEIETPQSVNLDFQTGVAPKTLVFGSVRWVDWPQLDFSPPVYPFNPLVDYDNPTFTYSLGVGYKFSEEFSGAVTFGYETAEDEPVSNLGPTDGFWSVSVGGTYSLEKAKISGGVRYTDIGDATANGAGPDARADFSGNSAWSVGIQITYSLG